MDETLLYNTLDTLLPTLAPPVLLVEGEARGADQMALAWGKPHRGIATVVPIPAHWQVHHPDTCSGACPGSFNRYNPHCSLAGFRRNGQMVNVAKAYMRMGQQVQAAGFRIRGHSPGTDQMAQLCQEAGIPLLVTHEGGQG